MAEFVDDIETGWTAIRAHSYKFVPPDLLIFRANGDVSVDDAREFFAIFKANPWPEKGFFYLSNVTHLRHQTAQVVNEFKELPANLFRVMAVVGATFAHRVLIDGMGRVIRFLKIHANMPPTRFFDTEKEALEWFDRVRRGEE